MGSGGAPEGVLAAAALRCVGGQFQGRLLFRNEDERARARKWGIDDLDRIYHIHDLAKRSEEHTSELESLMRSSYADFCLKKQNHQTTHTNTIPSLPIYQT